MIRTRISKYKITFTLDKPLRFLGKTKINFTYDIDISKTPKHVANYMLGILLSEHFSWNTGTVMFGELTRKEIDSIRYHERMNRFADPYGRVIKGNIKIFTNKLVGDSRPSGTGPTLVCNGMGKDGLLAACLGNELTSNIKPFTAGNQYRTTQLWDERKRAMSDFYNTFGMPQANYIMTDYLQGVGYKIIPWWVMGLPLAYALDSNAILMGCEIPFSKTRVKSKRLLRPNLSIFSYDNMRKTTGVYFSSPTHAVSAYGAQKILIERYPEALKYQRSCMEGMAWCNKCGECHKTAMYFENAKVDMRKIGLIHPDKFTNRLRTSKTNPITQDIVDQMHRKLAHVSYNDFFEKANENVFPLLWNGKKLRRIFSEHFEIYKHDPGADGIGYEYLPSKWGQWIKDGMI